MNRKRLRRISRVNHDTSRRSRSGDDANHARQNGTGAGLERRRDPLLDARRADLLELATVNAIDYPRELVRGRRCCLCSVDVSLPLGRPGSYCVLPRRPFLREPGCTRTCRAQAPFPRASENLVDPPRGLLPRSMSPDIPDSGS